MTTINGSTPVFDLFSNYDIAVRYTFENSVTKLGSGNFSYSNAEKSQPIALYELDFSVIQQYNYARDFFAFVNGNQDIFCFYDPFDHYCHYPEYNTKLGVTTRGEVALIDGKFYLVKKYSLVAVNGTFTTTRIITRPKENSITVYDANGAIVSASVSWDTGEVYNGQVGWRWGGDFYTPVRFDTDLLPLQNKGFTRKNNVNTDIAVDIPNIVFKEVRDTQLNSSQSFSNSYEHEFVIPFSEGYNADMVLKTDIQVDASGFEKRTATRNVDHEFSFSNTLIYYSRKEYLITLCRLCLGTHGNFIIDHEFSSGIRDYFSFSELSFGIETFNKTHEFLSLFNFSAKFSSSFNRMFTTYCHCWLITRKDGVEIGFTNHNAKLVINGVTYYPQGSFLPNSTSRSAETNDPQQIELRSYLTDVISEEDILTDRFKNARIKIFYYDWVAQSVVYNFYEGFIDSHELGYLSNGAINFGLFGDSIFKLINVDVKVETQANCRAKFLSSYCGINTSSTFLYETRTITAIEIIENRMSLYLNANLPTAENEYWSIGKIQYTSGKLIGITLPIAWVFSGGNAVTLAYYSSIYPELGDSIIIWKGCKKTPQSCDHFSNIINYRGEPRATGDVARYHPSFS